MQKVNKHMTLVLFRVCGLGLDIWLTWVYRFTLSDMILSQIHKLCETIHENFLGIYSQLLNALSSQN